MANLRTLSSRPLVRMVIKNEHNVLWMACIQKSICEIGTVTLDCVRALRFGECLDRRAHHSQVKAKNNHGLMLKITEEMSNHSQFARHFGTQLHVVESMHAFASVVLIRKCFGLWVTVVITVLAFRNTDIVVMQVNPNKPESSCTASSINCRGPR